MNTLSPVSNRQVSFGMFVRPNQAVIKHFSEVINELTPENRAIFVAEVEKYVEQAKKCPVPIDHSLSSGYYSVYVPYVDGYPVTTKKVHSLEANRILDVMSLAVKKAENKADANKNIEKICKIFEV